MFSRVERLLAWRYLRSKRREGFVSVITGFSLVGIALGVATLIVVMAVMNGFRHELLSRIMGVNGHVSVYAVEGGIPDYDALRMQVAEVPGVVSVMPMVQGQVMVMAGDQHSGAQVKGYAFEDIAKKETIANNMIRGTLNALHEEMDGTPIVIGDKLARKLSLRIGDTLTLISPQGHRSVVGVMPRLKSYTLVGTFEVGMYEYDVSTIYMLLEDAQRYFKLGNQVSTLEVMADSPMAAPEVARAIMATIPNDYYVYDWQRSNAHFFNALQVERNVMFLILTMIILIAAFNIVSGLVMLVKDKQSNIAILRTMGMGRRGVMRVFLLCGSFIGLAGTMSGAVLGLAFALNIESIRQLLEGLTGTELFAAEIYFLSQLPAIVDPSEVMAIVGMALGLSFLATLYPAWRAARLDPVEALRYE